ncbi:RTA1 like protein-domain-containing protein [Mycena metata]|uniref:RTA1 like protein-domain-containing protein n=1 Tax=Mycena metata TaxID=1033252 RepID=A0AAD7NPP9_9AGAR|nr:RTA1 like protein-domain-containing protein [Mycena metata]
MSRVGHYLLVLAAFSATVLAADGNSTASDDHTRIIGGYVPKKVPAYIALILYAVSAAIQWTHFTIVTPRRPFILSLTLGMTAMALGFIFRVIYSNTPTSLGKYIIMDLFILLSPCLFLATDYMLLSHLARTFDDEVADRCLLIRHSCITKIFVWSDVTTFLLQSSGGGLSVIKSLANVGNTIALIGLIMQALSFLLFTVVLLVFGFRVSKHFPNVWHPQNPRPFKLLSRQPINDWRIVFYMMALTCVGILIRSVFRVAEFAGGFLGPIATHEGYFYVFDSLPLWIAMSLYCVVWPPRALIKRSGLKDPLELNSTRKLNPAV